MCAWACEGCGCGLVLSYAPPRFLMVSGDYIFKELKKRFFALIQLSQYKFVLTTYSAGEGV